MISVVVPLFNKEDQVERCIRSILSQTYSDLELIVVDDGSTDSGPLLISSIKDARLRIVRQSNKGPGHARNTGMMLARGELITFLDADDEWKPHFLQYHFDILKDKPDLAVSTTCYYEFPGRVEKATYWLAQGIKEGEWELGENADPAHTVTLLSYITNFSTVARRNVLQKFGGFYARGRCLYGEDTYLWLQVLLNHRVHISMEHLSVYHREDSDLTKLKTGPRSIEPLITDPSHVLENCPAAHTEHLYRVLAAIAFKTAAVVGFWGDWQRASRIRGTFRPKGARKLPYFYASWILSKPLVALPLIPIRKKLAELLRK
jgi:glycosyltransferase involved in cell wall biosynthesis